MQIKPFEPDPQTRYIKLTNYLFDVVMPTVKPNTWKVLCFVIRKTTGFNKPEDILSISQIMQGTGIRNRNTVTAAVDDLEKLGFVLVDRERESKHIDGNAYQLNLDYEVTSTEIVLPTRTGDTENVLPDEVASTKIVLAQDENQPKVVRKSYTQKANDFKTESELELHGLPSDNPTPADAGSQGEAEDEPKKEKQLPVMPDTPEDRILFAKLGREFSAKGHKAPKKFPSLACKERFNQTAGSIGQDELKRRIDIGLQQGMTSVIRLVNYVCGNAWNSPKPTYQNGHVPPESKPVDPALKKALENFVPPNQR